MALRLNEGTCNQPIEIPDSDEESYTLRNSSFIDLSRDDLDLPSDPPNLQQPARRKKDSLKSPSVYSCIDRWQPPERVPCPSSVEEGQRGPLATHNNTNIFTTPLSPQLPQLIAHRNVSVGPFEQITSGEDADSESSDVIDESYRRRLRRARSQRSRTLEDTPSNIAANNSATARKPFSEVPGVEAQRVRGDLASYDQTRSSPQLLAMEGVLRSIWQEMEHDHAALVRDQLQKASIRSKKLQDSLPDLSDAIDPFAELTPINESDASSKANDEGNTSNADYVHQIPERLPRYKHYVTITRSFLVPDNHKLYFEPYLGQNVDDNEMATQRWLEKLRKLYDSPDDEKSSNQREYGSRLKMYLPRMLERLDLNWKDVLSYIIDTGLVVIGAPKTPLARLLIAFKNVFGIEISDVFPEYNEYLEAMRTTRRNLDKPEEIDPIKSLLQPHLLSCPVCHVYLCGVHGVYETDSSEDEEKDEPSKVGQSYADMNMTYEGIMYRQKDKPAHLDSAADTIYKGKPCGSNCFSQKGNFKVKQPSWTPDEETYFNTLFLGMQGEPRAACILAPLMGRPCYDVQELIISLKAETKEVIRTDCRKGEKLDWYDNRQKKIRVDLDWGKKTNTHLHDKIRQPTGCEHLGISCFEARDRCSCNEEGILCDKFCACADDCYMKFTGCDCIKGDSPCSKESLTCPCQLLNRECDPDLCDNCGAAETVDPFARSQEPWPHNCCRNTDIQRGVRKRLLVGESSHPGNIGSGAYTAEAVKQGEFIAEYVGEIISYAECGRRSEIYDRLKMSFIFDLNDEVVIDSYRYGNVERFINHSKKHANCKPLVKLVNGEHRIGFFATKDLHAGVELFFDYGREFVLKQGLKEIGDVPRGNGVSAKKAKGPSKEVKDVTKGMRTVSEETDVAMDDDDDDMPAVVYSFPDDGKAENTRRVSNRARRNVKAPKKYTR